MARRRILAMLTQICLEAPTGFHQTWRFGGRVMTRRRSAPNPQGPHKQAAKPLPHDVADERLVQTVDNPPDMRPARPPSPAAVTT
jgi:hypothetical protein